MKVVAWVVLIALTLVVAVVTNAWWIAHTWD